MTVSDEIVRVEELKTERFMALGLSRCEAIRAVEDAIDAYAVETLSKAGCPLTLALEIAR